MAHTFTSTEDLVFIPINASEKLAKLFALILLSNSLWFFDAPSFFAADILSGKKEVPLHNILFLIERVYKVRFELLIDGWGDDNCVSEELLCYRVFIWEIGKPKPKVYDDIGAYKTREEALDHSLIYFLEQKISNEKED